MDEMVPTGEVGALFDHLVGASEQPRRNGMAECLRGLEVDRKLVCCRSLYRKVGGLFAVGRDSFGHRVGCQT